MTQVIEKIRVSPNFYSSKTRIGAIRRQKTLEERTMKKVIENITNRNLFQRYNDLEDISKPSLFEYLYSNVEDDITKNFTLSRTFIAIPYLLLNYILKNVINNYYMYSDIYRTLEEFEQKSKIVMTMYEDDERELFLQFVNLCEFIKNNKICVGSRMKTILVHSLTLIVYGPSYVCATGGGITEKNRILLNIIEYIFDIRVFSRKRKKKQKRQFIEIQDDEEEKLIINCRKIKKSTINDNIEELERECISILMDMKNHRK